MARGCALALALVMALPQILPAPFAAPAWAQVRPPGEPSVAPDILPDEATCTQGSGSAPPLAMAPLDKEVTATVILTIAKDGKITAASLYRGRSSGDAALDAALLAHVQKTWHLPECGAGRFVFRVHFPHITCAPQPLPETRTLPDVDVQDRPRAVDLQIGVAPDGTVVSANVTGSSGDARLDAAAVAHVKQAWRWQPYACKDTQIVMGTASMSFPYAIPDPPAPAP